MLPYFGLVAGVFASGKTSYSAWLEREQDFLHLDLDELERRAMALRKTSTCVTACVTQARGFSGPSLISASHCPRLGLSAYPPNFGGLPQSERFRNLVVRWRPSSGTRESFIRRATVPIDAFDIQIVSIVEYWQRIQNVFDENLIYTVSESSLWATPEYIYSENVLKASPTHAWLITSSESIARRNPPISSCRNQESPLPHGTRTHRVNMAP